MAARAGCARLARSTARVSRTPHTSNRLTCAHARDDRLQAFGAAAPFAASLAGNFVVRSVRDGVGILINPGSDVGFEITAPVVANLADHVRTVLAAQKPST